MTHTHPPKRPSGRDRRVSELVRTLASDSAALLRQEVGLVRAELRASARSFGKHLGQVAVGGGVAATGLLVLVAFAVIGLGMLLGDEYWLSALIVALVLLAGGGGMIAAGVRKLGRASVKPTETVRTVRESADWAKDELRELRAGIGGGDVPQGAPRPTALPSHPGRSVVALESRPGEPGGADVAWAGGAAATTRPAGKIRAPLSLPLHRRVMMEVREDDVMGQAAKVAYYMFTSLPPALLVLFALAGLYGGDRLGDYLETQLRQVLPGSADDPSSAAGFITQFIDQVVQTSAPGPLSIGLVLGIWAASAVFVALSDALNTAYDVVDDRSWLRRRAIAVGVMIGFVALFLVASIVLIAGPQIASALGLFGAAELAWSVIQWPLAFAVVVIAFFLAYYVLPDRDQSSCKGALLKGSAIAAALWVAATVGFRLYIANFGSYGETYGFVGAILVLLLWMYVTSIVILLGGEVASEMERGARA